MVQTWQRCQIILKRRSNEASLFNRWLPLELITAIFEICCDSGSTTRNLLAICAVCSSWRFIAIGAPMLWNTIQYCSNSSKRPLVDLLGIHVVRSKIVGLLPDRIGPDAGFDPSDWDSSRGDPHPADGIRYNPADTDGSADGNSKAIKLRHYFVDYYFNCFSNLR
jgi:hypothetical protein